MLASTSLTASTKGGTGGGENQQTLVVSSSQTALNHAIDDIKETFQSLWDKAAEADILREDNEKLKGRERELVGQVEEQKGRITELENELKHCMAKVKERDTAYERLKKLVGMVKNFQKETQDILQEESPGTSHGKRKIPEGDLDGDLEEAAVVVNGEKRKRRRRSAAFADLDTPHRERERHSSSAEEEEGRSGGGSRQLALPGGKADMAMGGEAEAELAEEWRLAVAEGGGEEAEIVREFDEEGFDGREYTKEEAIRLVVEKVRNWKSCGVEYHGVIGGQAMIIPARVTWFETSGDIVYYAEYEGDYYTLSGWLMHIKDKSKRWKDHVYVEERESDGGYKLLSNVPPFSGAKQASSPWIWKRRPAKLA